VTVDAMLASRTARAVPAGRADGRCAVDEGREPANRGGTSAESADAGPTRQFHHPVSPRSRNLDIMAFAAS
jgi:hypothetical protein